MKLLKTLCRRFDHDASQKRVGLRKPQRLPRNHISLELNEHDMALNVFWSRLGRDGRRVDAHRRLTITMSGVIKRLTKKTEPEGAMAEIIQSASFGSKIKSAKASTQTR